MLFQSKVYILFYVILVSYEIQVSTENMITSVTRNNVDIFRVGEEGCKNDQSICTNVAASCQQNDGLCRCDKNDMATHFRNPVIIRPSTGSNRVFGDSYGCITDTWISPITIEPDHPAAGKCSFKPFQLLKSEPSTTYTTFNYEKYNNFKSCQLHPRRPPGFVKYPNNNTLMKLDWLNDSYVELNVSGNSLHFKWKKPVHELQGTIIKIRLYCERTDRVSGSECFEGKISGTWGRYEPSLTTASPRTNNETETSNITSISTVITTISNDSSSTVITASSFSNNDNNNDNDLNSGKIAAIIIPVVVFIVVVIILLWCVCKKRKEKRKNKEKGDVKLSEATSEYDYPAKHEKYENPGRKNPIYENQPSIYDVYAEPNNEVISSGTFTNDKTSSHYQTLDHNNDTQDVNTYQTLVHSQKQ